MRGVFCPKLCPELAARAIYRPGYKIRTMVPGTGQMAGVICVCIQPTVGRSAYLIGAVEETWPLSSNLYGCAVLL